MKATLIKENQVRTVPVEVEVPVVTGVKLDLTIEEALAVFNVLAKVKRCGEPIWQVYNGIDRALGLNNDPMTTLFEGDTHIMFNIGAGSRIKEMAECVEERLSK